MPENARSGLSADGSIRLRDAKGKIQWICDLESLPPGSTEVGRSVVPRWLVVDSLWVEAGEDDLVYLRGLLKLMGLNYMDVARVGHINPGSVGHQLRGTRPISLGVRVAILSALARHLGGILWLISATEESLAEAVPEYYVHGEEVADVMLNERFAREEDTEA